MEAVALIFGTYVITAALIYSDGPWGLLYKARNNNLIKDFGVLECFLCSSLYVAIVLTFVIGLDWWYSLIAWGTSVIVDKIITIYSLQT